MGAAALSSAASGKFSVPGKAMRTLTMLICTFIDLTEDADNVIPIDIIEISDVEEAREERELTTPTIGAHRTLEASSFVGYFKPLGATQHTENLMFVRRKLYSDGKYRMGYKRRNINEDLDPLPKLTGYGPVFPVSIEHVQIGQHLADLVDPSDSKKTDKAIRAWAKNKFRWS